MLAVEAIDSFYGAAHVLQGISLQVPAGAIVALLGRNGAGKSTTLRSILGIVRVRAGRVLLGQEEITGLACDAVARRGVAFVPEERGVIPNLTVAENLRLGIIGSGGQREAGRRLDRALGYFPALKPLLHRRGGLLSGGEQQMLSIARAVAAAPRLMLVDEPTEGLSPLIAAAVVEGLRRINGEGTAILLVEQNLEVAQSLARQVYVIDQGQVRFEGPPDALARDAALTQALLGV
ncbi:MAG: ABC transporter ATP-binding protein [Dongiaceae bacterium]